VAVPDYGILDDADGEGRPADRFASRGAAAVDRRLPFTSFSSDPEQQFLPTGLRMI